MHDSRSFARSILLSATLCITLAACSSSEEDAEPEVSRTSTSTTAPTTSTTAAPTQSLEPALVEALADLAGKLVFRSEEGDIVVAGSTGADAIVVGNGTERRNSQPTWSNAGDRIAWSSFSPAGANLEIAPSNGTAGTETRMETAPFFLSWSKDDTWLGGLRPTSTGIEFMIVETAEGTVRPVGAGQPFYFDWRDDSSLIAAVNGTSLVNIPASPDLPPSEIDTASPLGVFQTPAALAGEEIVLAMNREGSNDVVVLGPDGLETAIATTDGPLSTSINPVDGRLAVLVAETAPQSQVIGFQVDALPELPSGRVSIVDRTTGGVTTLDEPRIVATQWSPDGATLAILQVNQEDLRWLLVTSEGTAETTPFLPSNEFASSYLPFADQYNHSSSWWSPDSRALVISGSIEGEAGIWVDLVDDDKAAVRIAGGDIALWSPR
jgi:hypothetical protein